MLAFLVVREKPNRALDRAQACDLCLHFGGQRANRRVSITQTRTVGEVLLSGFVLRGSEKTRLEFGECGFVLDFARGKDQGENALDFINTLSNADRQFVAQHQGFQMQGHFAVLRYSQGGLLPLINGVAYRIGGWQRFREINERFFYLLEERSPTMPTTLQDLRVGIKPIRRFL